MTEDLRAGDWLKHYQLLQRIGRGGMATVWVAREVVPPPGKDRLVAVKAILADLADNPAFVKMFMDEGRLVQSIRHENVVDVYEVHQDRGFMFMSMEWVEGDALHAIIAEAGKRRPIPPEMAVRIVADAAAGLHAAHEVKSEDGESMAVVHRDVSPHNILVGVDGKIKLVDFGVAKAMGRLTDSTRAGQIKGKFGYMSPEQARGKDVDRRSDIFSLGIVLYELTTGKRLFKGENEAATLHLVTDGAIPPPSTTAEDYPAELEVIVLKALERDVEKRFQTAAEFSDELNAYLRQERMVVPRKGIAGLLKRVLGKRIEGRRRAIRDALERLSQGPHSSPLSSESAFGPLSEPGSGISNITGSVPFASTTNSGLSQTGSDVSHLSHVSLATGAGTQAPQTVGQRKDRAGIGGYLVGVLGLAVALAVLLFVIFRSRDGGTNTVVIAPAVQPASSEPEPVATAVPKPTASDDTPSVSLDALGTEPTATPQVGGPVRRTITKKKTTTTTTKKARPSTKPGDLPRKNPYQ